MANSKNILRIVGVDGYRGMPVDVDKLQQTVSKQSQPFTQGLQYVDKALDRVNQSMVTQKEAVASRTDSIQQALTSQGRAVAMWSEAATRIGQMEPNADFATKLEKTIGLVTRALEQAKIERQQANRALANERVQELKLRGRSEVYKTGTVGYVNELKSTLDEYDLAPQDREGLYNDGYSVAHDYMSDTTTEQQRTYRKVQERNQAIMVAQHQLKLNAPLSQLAADPYSDPKPKIDIIDKTIAEVYNDSNIPEDTKSAIVLTILQQTLESVGQNNTARAVLTQRIEASRQYVSEENEINKGVNDGTITPSQAKVRKQELRLKLGVHPNWQDVEPNEDEKFKREILSNQRAIREMEEEGMISATEAVEMSDGVVATTAWSIITNPGLAEQLRNDPTQRNNPGVVKALALANTYNENKQVIGGLRLRRQSLITDITELQKPVVRTEKMTNDEYAELVNSRTRVIDSKKQEIVEIDRQITERQEVTASYGLYGTNEEINTRMQSYTGEREAYTTKLEEAKKSSQRPNGGSRSPFESGVGLSYGTMEHNGKNVRLPFRSNAKFYPVSGSYAEQRGNRQHAGVDIPADEGTDIVSLVNGRVVRVENEPDGYGYYVDIKGEDGKLYRYAHIQANSAYIKLGGRVVAGQPIARVGSTGSSTGAHLHLEVRDPNKPYGFDGTVNPLDYLSSQNLSTTNSRQPKTNPSEGQVTGIPPGAIPLGHGRFLKDGRLYVTSGTVASSTGTYSKTTPVRTNYIPTKTGVKVKNNPNNNYGYVPIKNSPELSRAIAWGADQLKIPAQWLADLIALETKGTFSASIDNGAGFIGYIQAGEAARKDLGVSPEEFRRMTPMQQMERVVVPYVKMHIKWADSSLKGPEWLVAAVWGGHTLVRDLDKRGAASVNDPKNNDGGVVDGYDGVTFREYLDMLGSHAGRKYDHLGNRSQRVAQVTHTSPRTGCKFCSALRESGGFVPHEGDPLS